MGVSEKVLSIRDLTKSYGGHAVLNGVNLEVERGQIIGYIGPNGAGKSTTVKIMLGLVQDYKGHVEIFGQDISSGDPSYKKRIGYVPEQAELYDNLTAMEYLVFTGNFTDSTVSMRRRRHRSSWRNSSSAAYFIPGSLRSQKA